jgi:hypothetical protein
MYTHVFLEGISLFPRCVASCSIGITQVYLLSVVDYYCAVHYVVHQVVILFLITSRLVVSGF